MLKVHREFIVASLLVCAGLASVLGSADPGVQAPVKTRIFRVERPTSEGAPYTVLSTADGRVYTVRPDNDRLIQELLELSVDESLRVPVQLTLAGDEIVAVKPLSAQDAANYKDPVSDVPPQKLADEVDGTSPTPVAVAEPVVEEAVVEAAVAEPVAEPVVVAEEVPATPAPVPAPIQATEMPLPPSMVEFKRRQNYDPTILGSVAEAQRLFDEERNLSHTSQCHERAMVWSHDMFRARGIKSMKVMMFYTQRFRTTFQHKSEGFFGDSTSIYKWWYHTAPAVYVKTGRGILPYVLDREFLDRAVTIDEWSYHFMVTEIVGNNNEFIPYSNVSSRKLTSRESQCQIIGNFREYAVPRLQDQLTNYWCQVRIFPMYYMQPGNVAMMDCDESKDADYTRGLTGYGWRKRANGARSLDRLGDGRYKMACSSRIQTSFDKKDLETAYDHASERAADPRTGR
jgi:hypothetical protein